MSFGMGAAITRYLIKANIEHGDEEERKVFGLFIKIFRWIAGITIMSGVALSLSVGLWYTDSLTEEYLEQMRILVVLLSVNMAINFYATPYISVVNAHERFLFLQIMAITGTCLAPIFNLIALLLGYASIGLAISSLFATIIFRIAFYVYVEKSMSMRPVYVKMPKSYIREILIFSFWIFMSTVTNQLYEATDTVMIGAIPALGITAVAVYNIGVTFNGVICSINAGISSLLVPKANKMALGGATPTELTDTAIRMGRIQALIISLFIFGFITFGREFIHFYAGDAYASSYWIAVLCMLPCSIPLVQSFCLNILVARNKNKFRAIVYFLIAVINVVATWFAMKVFGVVGAAMASSFAMLIGHGFMMNWFYSAKLKLQMFRFWRSVCRIFLPAIALSIMFIAIGNFVNYNSISILLPFMLIYAISYCIVQWFLSMNQYEKFLIKDIFHIGRGNTDLKSA